MKRLLAVAYQTAESEEFVSAVTATARSSPGLEVVLLVPATPVTHLAMWTEGESRAVAGEKAEKARQRLERAGITIEARIGDPDPYQAVMDLLTEESFDAMIVSTFPPGLSRWLGADLISRLRRAVDLPITHVVAH